MNGIKTLMGCLFVLGCGGDVDLGRDADRWYDLESPSDPGEQQLFYETEADNVVPIVFAVDETRVSLLLGRWDTGEVEFVSCPVDRCATERTTRVVGKTTDDAFGGTPEPTSRMTGVGTSLIWDRRLVWTNKLGVYACAIEGCAGGPTTLHSGIVKPELVSDGESLYWMSDALYAAAPGAEPSVKADYKGRLAILDRHLVGADAEFVYLKSDTNEVARLSKTDGATFEPLIASLPNMGGVSVTAQGIYFTKNILTGSVRHCPLTGCEGEAAAVVANQAWPWAVYGREQDLLWITADQESAPRMVAEKCLLPGCAERQTLAVFQYVRDQRRDPYWESVALNSTYFFWFEQNPNKSLRRVRR